MHVRGGEGRAGCDECWLVVTTPHNPPEWGHALHELPQPQEENGLVGSLDLACLALPCLALHCLACLATTVTLLEEEGKRVSTIATLLRKRSRECRQL